MDQNESQTISVGNWIVTYIITAIPLVNLVALLIWAFSGSTPPSKKNWAIASLIFLVVLFGVGILSALILPAFVAAQEAASGGM